MDFEGLAQAMGDLKRKDMLNVLNEGLEQGVDVSKALDACQQGMDIIGEKFDEGEYYVSDLIYAGELMKEAVDVIKPIMTSQDSYENLGKAIMCTVHDDLHDIGKNIVKAMMETAGFEVYDLGVDASPEEIIETAKAEDIHIIALSVVLTLAIDSMKDTVDALHEAGVDAKIIVGGNPVNEKTFEETGADAWGLTPQDTVNICRNWIKEMGGVT